jgi:peptidoglycan/xylan/chitin deacetylase (PgdA/CDA1 family)
MTAPGARYAGRGYLTVSADDGHPSDLRTADLLHALGFTAATFYVPATHPGHPVLGPPQLRRLAGVFELGSHTFTHATLTGLSGPAARREIHDGKAWLEDVTGQAVRSFCYPRGKFNERVVALVAAAGFAGARTTMTNLVGPPRNPFLCGVSTHAFSHSRAVQVRHALLERNWHGLRNFMGVFRAAGRWDAHFLRAAAFVARHGGVAHLWLHSWEIDRHGEWSRLRDVLQRVRDHYRLVPVTNGELFAQVEGAGPAAPGAVSDPRRASGPVRTARSCTGGSCSSP